MDHNGKVKDTTVKPLEFIGSSRKDLRGFPKTVREVFGHDLHEIQNGETPESVKKLSGLAGVMELVKPFDRDTYRAVYVVNIGGTVYVLHCFKKKSKRGIATPKPDMDLIRERLKQAKEIAKGEG